MKFILPILLLALGVFGRPLIAISGGENKENENFGNRPTYVFLKYQVDGDKEKWVGLFCNSFAEAVESDKEAHRYALKARNLSIAKTITVISAPVLLFIGINELNSSIKTEGGKNDLSKASTEGIIYASSGFGMLVTSGIFWLIEKSTVRKSATLWNRNLKFGYDPDLHLNESKNWEIAQRVNLSMGF